MLNGGMNIFKWKLMVFYSIKEWKYYIMKKGWNLNKFLM